MSRYDPLKDALFRHGGRRVSMTFAEIEALVGQLPTSARKYHGWWANEDGPVTRHVQARAWGDAGYKARADRLAERVVFTRD